MKKFDRDLVAETLAEMGMTITYDNENPGFIDAEGDILYLSEIQDVLQLLGEDVERV